MSKPDPGVALDLHGLSLGQEPIGDAALIEHLDGAGVKPKGPRSVNILVGAPFDDGHVDPRQGQLAASISPVGPPPAITTACSVVTTTPSLTGRVMISTLGRLRQAPSVALFF